MRLIFLNKVISFQEIVLFLSFSFLSINSLSAQETTPLNEQESKLFLQNLVYKYGQNLLKLKDDNIVTTNLHQEDDEKNRFKVEISILDEGAISILDEGAIQIKSTLVSWSPKSFDSQNVCYKLASELSNVPMGVKKIDDSLKVDSLKKVIEKNVSYLEAEKKLKAELEESNRLINDSLTLNLKLQNETKNSKQQRENDLKLAKKVHEKSMLEKMIHIYDVSIADFENMIQYEKNELAKNALKINVINAKIDSIILENVDLKKNKDSLTKIEFTTLTQIVPFKNYKKFYNNLLLKDQRPTRFFLGASLLGNLNYRILSATGTNSNSNERIDERNENEFMLPNITGGFNLGFANYAHHFSLSYSYQKFGMLLSEYNKINPKTGYYSNTDQFDKQYSRVNLFGFQYEYSNYWRRWSPYFQAGIQVIFDDRGEQDLGNQRNNYFGTSIKSGIGLSYKPWYRAEFHVCPTGLILLNSAEATYVNTRYFALGLEFGVHVYMNKCLPRKKK